MFRALVTQLTHGKNPRPKKFLEIFRQKLYNNNWHIIIYTEIAYFVIISDIIFLRKNFF